EITKRVDWCQACTDETKNMLVQKLPGLNLRHLPDFVSYAMRPNTTDPGTAWHPAQSERGVAHPSQHPDRFENHHRHWEYLKANESSQPSLVSNYPDESFLSAHQLLARPNLPPELGSSSRSSSIYSQLHRQIIPLIAGSSTTPKAITRYLRRCRILRCTHWKEVLFATMPPVRGDDSSAPFNTIPAEAAVALPGSMPLIN